MRRQNPQILIAVFAVAGTLALLARLPGPSPAEAARLAPRFQFSWQTLPAAPLPPGGVVHEVNRNTRHLQFYLYQLGASAALGDLDGDGLPNDLCLTDIRAKTLTVGPVPGTGDRYPAFTLDAWDRVDRRTEHPSVCRVADMNEDGLADLFVAFWGRAPLLLLRRATPDLRAGAPLSMASFAVSELVPDGASLRWYSTTATFADVDGDGHQDILIGNYYADGSELTDGRSSKPFEMNASFSRARNGGTSRIFLRDRASSGPAPRAVYRDAGDVIPGDGERAWALAVGAADLDRDGLSELYIANDFGPDQLLWNRSQPGQVRLVELHGEKGFFRPESMVLGDDSFKGMSIDFGDVNDDGLFDMTVSNIASPFALQESHFLWMSTGRTDRMKDGVAQWIDRADDVGVSHSAWAWDSRFEDFDNDGVLELVQATGLMKGTANRWPDLAQVGAANDVFTRHPGVWPKVHVGSLVDGYFQNPFWVLGRDGRYVDLAPRLFPGYTPNTRGIAVGDVDGDGDPDLVNANLWEDSEYIENQTRGGAFLGLHLLLSPDGASASGPRVHAGHPSWREGTPAVGAFAEATAPDGRRLIRQVDGGNGHSGQRSPQLLFGLGKTPGAARIPVRITWRDARGTLHDDELTFTPGWHTVVLAAQGGTR